MSSRLLYDGRTGADGEAVYAVDDQLRQVLVGTTGGSLQAVSDNSSVSFSVVNLVGTASSSTHAVPKSVTDALDARLDALEASETVEALGVRMTAAEAAVVAAQSDADAAQSAADAAQSDVDSLSAQYSSHVGQDVRSSASVSFVNLTASGTINCAVLNAATVNTTATTSLEVADKTIVCASGAADTAAADGAGLVVDCGATDRTFLYNAAQDAFLVGGAAGGIGIDKLRLVDDLPAATDSAFYLSATDSVSPVIGRIFCGPGTGSTWKMHVSTRTSSTTTDRFTFREDGRLGVGSNTTSPGAILHLGSGSGADCGFLLRANNATTNGFQFYVASAGDAQMRLYNTNQPICIGATNSSGTLTESFRVHAPDSSNRTGVTVGSSAQNAGTLTVAGHSGRDRLVVRDESNSTKFSIDSSNVCNVLGELRMGTSPLVLASGSGYNRLTGSTGNSLYHLWADFGALGDAGVLSFNYHAVGGSNVIGNSGAGTSAVQVQSQYVFIKTSSATNTAPTTRISVATTGRVGINIGETVADAALVVKSPSSSGDDVLHLQSDSATKLVTLTSGGILERRTGSNAGRWRAYTAGASQEYGNTDQNGYLRVWPASSDFSSAGTELLVVPSESGTMVCRHSGGLSVTNAIACGSLSVSGTLTAGSFAPASITTAGNIDALGVSAFSFTGGAGSHDFGAGSEVLLPEKVVLTPKTPSSSSATGMAGQIAVDGNYVYVCTATNTWKRAGLSSW